MVFENKVLRRIFAPKRDNVPGEWNRLHNEELCGSVLLTKYYSGDQFEKNDMGGACGTYGDRRGAYRVLVGKPEGKRPPRRPRCRCRILRWIFKKCDVGAWTGLIWLRTATGSGLL